MKVGSSTELAEAEFRRQLPGILPRLSRFAMGLTRDRSEADDLLQAACERALSRTNQWNPGTRLDSWMFRIIQTIWWNELRARRVRELHLHREQAEQTKFDHARPEAQLLLLRAEQEIFQLPDDLRVVLLLVCVAQLSYREAAEVASIPIGTVMSRLARARLLLMERLGLAAEAVPSDDEKSTLAPDTLPETQAEVPSADSVPVDASSPSRAVNRPRRRTR